MAGMVTGCMTHKAAPKPAPVAVEPHNPAATSSPGAKFTILPAAVQSTVRAEAGSAEITDINKVTVNGRDIYKIQFRDPVANPTLFVADDGTLTSRDAYSAAGTPGGTGEGNAGSEAYGSLPSAVQRTLQELAPGATVAGINASQHTIYVITFQDPNAHPTLLITEDGMLLRAR
ncbi:MAG: hypothetical protein JWR26_1822 [Pedosphaera sp.]|nr:hypothetical protein [Pedosphaera sp.]